MMARSRYNLALWNASSALGSTRDWHESANLAAALPQRAAALASALRAWKRSLPSYNANSSVYAENLGCQGWVFPPGGGGGGGGAHEVGPAAAKVPPPPQDSEPDW
jgi:hypothetical protein